MFLTPDRFELAEIMERFELPELPDPAPDDLDPDEARAIILYRAELGDANVYLAEWVTLADAREYANRDDTRGEDWFVGFDFA